MTGNVSRDVARRLGRGLAIAAAAGLFLALSGAMETGGMPLAVRLAFWLPLMMAISPLGVGADLLSARLPVSLSPLVRWALTTTCLGVPLTLVVWAYTNLFMGRSLEVVSVPFYFGATMTITAAMAGISILVERPGEITHARAASTAALTAEPGQTTPLLRVRFLDRLPIRLKGAALHAVKAEDHYLRLYTSKGEDLILMRLGDAIAELEGIEGAQIHRSWWVAKEAVVRVERSDGKATFILPNGAAAPVSRANLKQLREAGWL